MTLVSLNMPEDPALLAGWLERQLTGLDLGALVAELSAIHGPPAQPIRSVRELLGPRLDEVFHQGLGVLPPNKLAPLLRQPLLLLQLQEAALTAGSPYWDRLVASDEPIQRRAEEGWRRLQAGHSTSTPVSPRPVVAAPRPKGGSTAIAWLLAASLLVAAGYLSHPLLRPLLQPGQHPDLAPPTVAWGWGKPGGIPHAGTAPEYLTRLADAAGEWFQQRPEDSPSLLRRLDELRQGCRKLIESEHTPLTQTDRDWLVQKCRDWLKGFDEARAALEAGRDSLQVREDVDILVNRLSTALRDRAATLQRG